ncbi:MAG: hypothetical protein M3O71_30055 [Bacteroidota bacterium]|nr:hypothetical protein [Bacteroidota bacterium]
MRDFFYILTINLLFALLVYKYFSYLTELFGRLKPPFFRLILNIAGRLQNLATYLLKAAGKKVDPNYRNLTAYARADPADPYIKLLQDCVQDIDTRNIALTGPHGSGKSSILKSFQLTHPEYHYLSISLASFKEALSPKAPKPDTPATPLPPEEEKDIKKTEPARVESIEYSILQQIFYHVRHRQIPFSRFKRIKNLPGYVILFRSIGLVLWIATFSYLLWHEKVFGNTFSWAGYLTKPPKAGKISIALYVILGAFYLCYIVLRVYNNSKFHKLNLTSGELEIAPDNDSSILNRHLDELLYFFEATKYNILIIEDLDRFDDPDIFIRLRELNNLINYSKQVNRKISFIYALKDDVFQDEQRTKFFDYIIPVIPIIDHRNSTEKIRERLEDLGLVNNEIPTSFIVDISFYIDDMRLLLNTINEFQLYRTKLNTTPGSYVYLLAMMIFKNKYPKVFADLHARKGLAYEVLNGKESFLTGLSEELNKEKKDLETLLRKVNDTYLKDKKELRLAYLGRLIESLTDCSGQLYTGSAWYDLKTLSENDELFGSLQTSVNLRYLKVNGNAQNTGISFKQLEDRSDPDISYKQREEEITLRQQYKKEDLQLKLQKTQLQLDEIRQYNLMEIFAVRPLATINSELAKNGLLNYMVTHGYLNEDYHYYLSYFYEGSLTRRDMDFFFVVKEDKNLPFDSPLDNIEELIKRLEIRDFERVGVLNLRLIDKLLVIQPKGEKALKAINLLIDQSENSIRFIKDYIRLGKQRDRFIEPLASLWPRFWVWVETESNLTSEIKLEYLGLILKNTPIDKLKALNIQNKLLEQIQEMPDFLTWRRPYLTDQRGKDVLQTLEIYFVQLNADQVADSLFDFVYAKLHYQLNPFTVELIVNAKAKVEQTPESIRTANLTAIINADVPALLEYIKAYPGYYVDEVFMPLPDNTQESEKAVLFLINEDELDIERRRQILAKSNIRLTDINTINVSLWPDVLKLSKLEATWPNIYAAYIKEETLTPELLSFLNEPENYKQLEEVELNAVEGITEQLLQPMAEAIMLSTNISLAALDHLLNTFTFYFHEPELDKLSREQIALILKHDQLEWSEDTFQFLQNQHPGTQLVYVENSLKWFFESITKLTLSALDYRLLFGSTILSNEQHQLLVEKLSLGDLGRDPELTKNLAALLEKTEFMPSVQFSVLLGVFTYLQSDVTKKRLLLKYIDKLNEENTGYLLNKMGEDYNLLPQYKRPKFAEEPLNETLLRVLEKKKYFVNTVTTKNGRLVANTKQKRSAE